MTGGRSPPQLCFSLSWLDSSSTAAALTFKPLYIGADAMEADEAKQVENDEKGVAAADTPGGPPGSDVG